MKKTNVFAAFNFSHHVNELSFGPFYPSLTNPLDNTVATTETNFYKYQYYLSVVPTIYTTDIRALREIARCGREREREEREKMKKRDGGWGNMLGREGRTYPARGCRRK